jgi:hypothetical protein
MNENQANPFNMKSAFILRSLLLTTAFLFSILTCKGQNDPTDQVVGTWTKSFNERSVTFTISADHKYQVEFAGDSEIDVWGSYVIDGMQITLNDEGGEYGSDVAGVYEFKVSETSIIFSVVDDPVYGRSILMEGSWSKGGEDKE